MARIARLVVPSLTQRGNRRMTVFVSQDDYALTLDLLASVAARWASRSGRTA